MLINTVQAKGKIYEDIQKYKAQGKFRPANSFEIFSKAPSNKLNLLNANLPSTSVSLDIKPQIIEKIISLKPETIDFNIPFQGKTEKILLYKVQNNTQIIYQGSNKSEKSKTLNYRGVLENGSETDIATVTFSEGQVIGSIQLNGETFVLQKAYEKNGNKEKLDQANKDTHVLYMKKDETRTPFNCKALDNPQATPSISNLEQNINNDSSNSGTIPTTSALLTSKNVRFYAEVANDIYLNKGANTEAFIQGVFNQVNSIFYNDGISTSLGTIYVWTTADPYVGLNSNQVLTNFSSTTQPGRGAGFDGDVAIFLNYSSNNGGIAYVKTLCNSPQVKVGYCGINSNYNTYPTFSWTVECIAHELGHILGSKHTHACAWNGNNTAIDGCAVQFASGLAEGTCAIGPIPAKGTVMSYCHLLSGVGIDLGLGFGPQPKAVITNAVNSASCLASSGSATDTVSPIVTITAPANNSTISGATVNFSATASDNNQVTKIELYIDNVLLHTVFTGTSNYTLNTTTFSNGSHTLSAKAYDAANNIGTTSITVNISNASVTDTIAPTVTITYPTQGLIIRPQVVN